MRIVRRSLAVLLAALLVAPAAQAQTHVINKSALSQAVQERVSQDQADREAILSLLHRQEVRQIAAQAGLSLEKAEAAVSTLNGAGSARPRGAGASGAERPGGRCVEHRHLHDDHHHRPADHHPDRPHRRLTRGDSRTAACRRRGSCPGGGAREFDQRLVRSSSSIRDRSQLLDVPYVLQSEELCGGAAVAMVMRYWGATGIYAESFSSLVDKRARGIKGEDLIRSLHERGWQAVVVQWRPSARRAKPGAAPPADCAHRGPPGTFPLRRHPELERREGRRSRSGAEAFRRARRGGLPAGVGPIRTMDAGRRARDACAPRGAGGSGRRSSAGADTWYVRAGCGRGRRPRQPR